MLEFGNCTGGARARGVIAHRGEIDLATSSEPHPAFAPLNFDPGGVLAIITSAGYAGYSAAAGRINCSAASPINCPV